MAITKRNIARLFLRGMGFAELQQRYNLTRAYMESVLRATLLQRRAP